MTPLVPVSRTPTAPYIAEWLLSVVQLSFLRLGPLDSDTQFLLQAMAAQLAALHCWKVDVSISLPYGKPALTFYVAQLPTDPEPTVDFVSESGRPDILRLTEVFDYTFQLSPAR